MQRIHLLNVLLLSLGCDPQVKHQLQPICFDVVIRVVVSRCKTLSNYDVQSHGYGARG